MKGSLVVVALCARPVTNPLSQALGYVCLHGYPQRSKVASTEIVLPVWI